MAGLASLVALLAVTLSSITDVNAIYTKQSPVLQVDSKNYDSLITLSNHTSV